MKISDLICSILMYAAAVAVIVLQVLYGKSVTLQATIMVAAIFSVFGTVNIYESKKQK